MIFGPQGDVSDFVPTQPGLLEGIWEIRKDEERDQTEEDSDASLYRFEVSPYAS